MAAPGKHLQDQRKKRVSISFCLCPDPAIVPSLSWVHLPVAECIIEDRGCEVPFKPESHVPSGAGQPHPTTWIEYGEGDFQ